MTCWTPPPPPTPTPIALVEPPGPAHRYTMHAPNIPETAKVAREMVAGLLQATGHTGLVETARLLVSEVVTNVHLHAKVPLLRLETTIQGSRLLVSVRDDDPRSRPWPTKAVADDDAEGGRGLLLVEACADAWGTVWHGGLQPTGKSVWFELFDACR
ncbi:ATP-binding protein [Streptomyces sp. H27-D2]|uniref:ATP-binding protein n=1 Tax=Streptomyces sp. H27-D2 TaxID=3046304 RepID=UPI002DB77549|nr:ATP-binding protein [Streptomyces sp. H27-D2]MEC4018097.1 ATP-binding protein [Streptomyces sp. H27-D2]